MIYHMFGVGEYVFDAVAGKGQFSCVANGAHTTTGARVAVKLESARIAQEYSVSFLAQEAETLSSLAHISNVPRVICHGREGEYRYVIMSRHGSDLDKVRKQNEDVFTYDVCMHVFCSVLDTLAMVHEMGIIHMDVKPDNILTDVDAGLERLVLCDFGISRSWRAANGRHNTQRKGEAKAGSYRYMSPNTQSGMTSSRRDDLYSLYFSVLFLLLGQLPWDDPSNKRKHEETVNMKRRLLSNACMAQVPSGFKNVYAEICALEFAERPDYAKLRQLVSSS